MENPNPYDPPTAVATESMPGFSFRSDWTRQGLRERRRSPHHRLVDVGFLSFTVLSAVTVLAAFSARAAVGLACLLLPSWFITSIYWMNSWLYRRGLMFASSCAGLCGPVEGRVDRGIVSVAGPELALAATTNGCTQSNWSVDGAAFRPPMVPEVLSISPDDIEDVWVSEMSIGHSIDSPDLLHRVREIGIGSGSVGESIDGEGQLKGGDFRGLPRWRAWNASAIVLAIGGLGGLAWGAYRWTQLPPWIRNRPSHYLPSDAEQMQLMILGLVAFVSLGILVMSLYFASRRWAKMGRYHVTLAPHGIAIASEQVAFAYRGRALTQFQVTDSRVIVRLPRGRVVFLIPHHWFSTQDWSRLRSGWLTPAGDDTAKASMSSKRVPYYLGPRV